jgi:hypothetical protein
MSGNQGSVSDTSYNTRMSAQAQIGTALIKALNAVAIIPAPSAGAVGSYVLAKSTTTVAYGATLPGSDLTPSNAGGTSTSGTLTGTWICVGDVGAVGDVTLFVRTS